MCLQEAIMGVCSQQHAASNSFIKQNNLIYSKRRQTHSDAKTNQDHPTHLFESSAQWPNNSICADSNKRRVMGVSGNYSVQVVERIKKKRKEERNRRGGK